MQRKKNLNKKHRRQKTYYILGKLYADIKENGCIITLKKLRGCQGIYDPDEEKIYLDYRRELVPSLIHEYLHKWYPLKNETCILQEERKIMNALSIVQIRNLLKIVVVN